MKITVENGKIVFCESSHVHAFDAHGEIPRPSIMPAVSVGGMHLSDRSDEVTIEKHTAIQDVAVGNGMAAWYIQEFLPEGADYKLSKRAAIYLGMFSSGEEKLIYKGECYGDLCFYVNDLFFNVGNKVAVYHIITGETEILFKHSGIKKSCIGLHITPKRIFFQHWTHSENHTMWYDRETKEIINPHFDGSCMSYLDDETIIYHGLDHAWRYDVVNMKKKRFFSNKEEKKIMDMVAEFFDIPREYFSNYYSSWSRIKFEEYRDERVYFECWLSYQNEELDYEKTQIRRNELGLPAGLQTLISCNRFAEDIRIEASKADIECEERPYNSRIDFAFQYVTLKAFPKKKE